MSATSSSETSSFTPRRASISPSVWVRGVLARRRAHEGRSNSMYSEDARTGGTDSGGAGGMGPLSGRLRGVRSVRGDDAVATGVLRLVHRRVGPPDQGFRSLGPIPGDEAGRTRLARGKVRAQPLHDDRGDGPLAIGQQDGELVAAESRQDVRVTKTGTPARGQLLQESVAALVSVAVVVLLEVVDVQDGHADERRRRVGVVHVQR